MKSKAPSTVQARAAACNKSASTPLETVSPRTVGVEPTLFRGYEQSMQALVQKGVISGCASVMLRRDKVIHAGAWGSADIEAKTRFDVDTLCRMVCATKPYVVVAFMTLVEEGLVSLDDQLGKYIPSFANVQVRIEGTDKTEKAKRPILMKHLLVHTSGIGYSGELGEKLEDMDVDTAGYQKMQNAVVEGSIHSLKAMVDTMAKVPLKYHPGYKYSYGYSFDVLGRVVEVIMGKRLDKCLQERVFEPLGMDSTKWAVPFKELGRLGAYYADAEACKALYGSVKGRSSKAKLCRIDGKTARESQWREGQQSAVLSGGGYLGVINGGVLSTVRDTVRFTSMLFKYGEMENGQRLLKRSTVVAMEKNRLNARTCGDDKVCYLGNIGQYREGGDEYGMGGAACTYWNIDRGDETATVWFTQNYSMPDFPDMKRVGVDPKKADMWGVLHKAIVAGSKRKQNGGRDAQAKRARKM